MRYKQINSITRVILVPFLAAMLTECRPNGSLGTFYLDKDLKIQSNQFEVMDP